MYSAIKRVAVKKDVFTINLEVAGRTYPLGVKRGDEQEEFLARKAAKRVQEYMIKYRQHFAKSVEDRDLLALIAIQLALEISLLEEKNDMSLFTQKIQRFTDMLDKHLSNK
jgi:cell division protein ZapA